MIQHPASPARNTALLTAAALVAGCASPAVYSPPGPAADSPPAVSRHESPTRHRLAAHEEAAVVAVRQLGVPYRYGGTGRDGFDCSGLVYFAYREAGKALPRTTGSLWRRLPPVARRDLRVGDVLFFRIAGKMSHVGLYLGDGRFVHAPSSGREVTIAPLDTPYYREAFVRAGRP